MNHRPSRLLVPVLLSTLLCAPAEEIDPVQAAAAKVAGERHESTVVLTVTRKIRGKDTTFEIPAVAIGKDGLLATSLKGIEHKKMNQVAMLLQLGGGQPGQEGDAAAAGELLRVAWLRPGGAEADADLVLTDEALDLAFVRVREAEGIEMPPSPPAAEASPVLLDEVLVIGRLSPEYLRAPKTTMAMVSALISTPRPLYKLSASVDAGVPAYNLRGEWLGMVALLHNEEVVVPAAAVVKRAAGIPPAKQDD